MPHLFAQFFPSSPQRNVMVQTRQRGRKIGESPDLPVRIDRYNGAVRRL
jgi:hypothetical protein